MKKYISFVSVSALLLLAGCQSTGSDSGGKQSAMLNANAGNLSSLKFDLPNKIQWDSTKENNGSAMVYRPQGSTAENSPVRVIYQFVKQTKDPKSLAAQVINPLRQNCEKPAVNVFKTNSRYPGQLNYETLCNQIKGRNMGIINYLSIYTGDTGSYLLIAEVKTPVSSEPGSGFKASTEQEKQILNVSLGLVKDIQKMMTETLVCDAKGKCQ